MDLLPPVEAGSRTYEQIDDGEKQQHGQEAFEHPLPEFRRLDQVDDGDGQEQPGEDEKHPAQAQDDLHRWRRPESLCLEFRCALEGEGLAGEELEFGEAGGQKNDRHDRDTR